MNKEKLQLVRLACNGHQPVGLPTWLVIRY